MAIGATFLEWKNPELVLIHGTTADAVISIRQSVNANHGRGSCDFGPGFYTTTSVTQAHRWAALKAARLNATPAVVQFSVSRFELAKLNILAFVRGDPDAADYWALVRHCRLGMLGHGLESEIQYYDVVAGPVARQWQQRRSTYLHYDQFSFHTATGAALLDQSRPEEVR